MSPDGIPATERAKPGPAIGKGGGEVVPSTTLFGVRMLE